MEVLICCQQRQVVALTELNQQGINRSDLDTPAATGIADVGGCDAATAVGLKKGEHGEALHELVSVPGAGKTLQHVLEQQTFGEHLLGTQESAPECTHLRHTRLAITVESQRPNRGLDQQTHRWRSRSAL